jgi:hypothetical protein
MSLFIFFKEYFSKFGLSNPTNKTVFDHYFFDHNYYLQKNASKEDFAPILNIDTQSLDKISMTYYGYPFTILINEYRYNHFVKELIHPINENLTLDSLIKLSGFDNNESFMKYVEEKKSKS